ncbi:helix-turn-helix domain-containing protein [Nitrospirillum viridazoti]|uniref:helix-turn-helix domain-containing protein n=1 Tax=Nitrospirillum viridazoti TaxID=3144925 RepID=UPI003CE46AC8
MSERDVRRVEVLSDVVGGRLTVSSAAAVLGLSERQVWRLLGRYRSGGAIASPAPPVSIKVRARRQPAVGNRAWRTAAFLCRYWPMIPSRS